jgi:L-fuconolactonase
MKIDSHQHFWKFDPVQHSWINKEMAVIRKDFLPADLEPVLKKYGFEGCVSVQVDHSLADTKFLLDFADKNSFIKGVVGWVDLTSPALPDTLAEFRVRKKLKGFRHILQGQPKGVMLEPRFILGVNTACKAGYTYDLLIYHHQFSEALEFLSATTDCPVVIDHIAKPPIRSREKSQWAADIDAAASFKNVYCKLSGMVTEADWNNWKPADLLPYMDVVFEKFGTKRIMYGSDWPVCLVAASYEQQLSVVTEYISGLSSDEQADVMGRNAARFYKLE